MLSKIVGLLVIVNFISVSFGSHNFDTQLMPIVLLLKDYYGTNVLYFVKLHSQKSEPEIFHNYKLLIKSARMYCGLTTIDRLASIKSPSKPLLIINKSLITQVSMAIKFIMSKVLNKESNTLQMPWKLLSGFSWLLPTSHFNEDDFKNVSIPYDVKFVVAVFDKPNEATRFFTIFNFVQNGSIQIRAKTKHQLLEENFFESRRDFQGAELVYVASVLDPCESMSFMVSGQSIIECIHFHMWKYVVEALNATTRGVIRPNRSSSSLVEAFNSGAVACTDFSLFSSIFTKEVDFFWPTIVNKYEMFTSYSGSDLSLDRYLRPLQESLWFLIFGSIALCAIVNLLSYYVAVKYIYDGGRGNVASPWQKMWTPLVTLSFQGDALPTRKLWERLLLIACLLTPCVIIPAYNAVLTSFLVLNNPLKPFNSLEELLARSDYKLAYPQNFYFFHELLQGDTKKNGSNYLLNKALLPKKSQPNNDYEGSVLMCREKLTLISVFYSLKAVNPACKFYALQKPFYVTFGSMAMPLRTPYRSVYNIIMHRLRYSGVQLKLKHKLVLKDLTDVVVTLDVEEQLVDPIKVDNIVFPLIILLIGIFLSNFFLILELSFYWFLRTFSGHKNKIHKQINY